MELWNYKDEIRHQTIDSFSERKSEEFKDNSMQFAIKCCLNELIIPLQVKYPEAFEMCINILREEIGKVK